MVRQLVGLGAVPLFNLNQQVLNSTTSNSNLVESGFHEAFDETDFVSQFQPVLNNPAYVATWAEQFPNVSDEFANVEISFPDKSSMTLAKYLEHERNGDFLYQWRAVMAHDAATGYGRMEGPIGYSAENTGSSNVWTFSAQTQGGGFAKQLDCGARALDLRAGPVKSGVVLMHHGLSIVKYPLADALDEVLEWSRNNPSELVLFYLNKWKGAQTKREVEKLLAARNIQLYSDCSSISHITRQQITTDSGGTGVFAIENCVQEQYDSDVKCCHVKFPLLGRRQSMSAQSMSMSSLLQEQQHAQAQAQAQERLQFDSSISKRKEEFPNPFRRAMSLGTEPKPLRLGQREEATFMTNLTDKFHNFTTNLKEPDDFLPDRRFQQELLGAELNLNATKAFNDFNETASNDLKRLKELLRNSTSRQEEANILSQKFRLQVQKRETPCCFHDSQPEVPFQRYADYMKEGLKLRQADQDKPLRMVQAHWQYGIMTYLHQWWHRDPSLMDQVEQSKINHLTGRMLHDHIGNFLEVDNVCDGGLMMHDKLKDLSPHVLETFLQGREAPTSVRDHINNILDRYQVPARKNLRNNKQSKVVTFTNTNTNGTDISGNNVPSLKVQGVQRFLPVFHRKRRKALRMRVANSTAMMNANHTHLNSFNVSLNSSSLNHTSRVLRGKRWLKRHKPSRTAVLRRVKSVKQKVSNLRAEHEHDHKPSLLQMPPKKRKKRRKHRHHHKQ